MSNAKLTLEQIEVMLEQLGLTDEAKRAFREQLILKNNINVTNSESVAESVAPVVSENRTEPTLNLELNLEPGLVETVTAPINEVEIASKNSSKKSRFFNLSKSFVSLFSKKHENKVTDSGVPYIEKTAVHASVGDNVPVEKQKSFMESIRSKAYDLGVTVSQVNSSLNNTNNSLGQKFINILKLSGEATAVERVESVLKEHQQENKLKSENSDNPQLLIEEVDEKEELAKVIKEHAEKYSYEYDINNGAIIFNNFIGVSANLKLDYVRRNFSHDIKQDLTKTIQYLEALEKSKMTKNIVILNNYAKSVDVFPGEIMKLLNENPTGTNLPSHPLLERVLANRVEILNDSINISNEMIKARVKESYLINVSKKMLDYVDELPINDLSPANREIRKSFKLEFLNKRIGARKIGESINHHIAKEESLKNLNITAGTEVKKTSVERANELALTINKTVKDFQADLNEIHTKYEGYYNKVVELNKIKEPTKKQMNEIDKLKSEMKLYFTKYNATYQSFVEENHNNFTQFAEIVGVIRKAKHTVVDNHKMKNKEYVKLKTEAERHNSNLLSGASDVVIYMVDNVGSLGNLQEQIHDHIVKNCSQQLRDMDRLDDEFKELDKKFQTNEEIENQQLYGDATDLMVAYKELASTFVKINEHVDKSQKKFETDKNKIENVQETELSALHKPYVKSVVTSIKRDTTLYNEGKTKLEDEFDLKFSAFRKLFLTTPQAKSHMKKFSRMGDFDISLWIDSPDPLERLSNGFNIAKKKNYARVEPLLNFVTEKKEEIIKIIDLIPKKAKEDAVVVDTTETKKPARKRVNKQKVKSVVNESESDTQNTEVTGPEIDIFDNPENQPQGTIAEKLSNANTNKLADKLGILGQSQAEGTGSKRSPR